MVYKNIKGEWKEKTEKGEENWERKMEERDRYWKRKQE